MRIEKQVLKELYLDRLKKSGFVVILGYQNLNVSDVKDMRNSLAGLSSSLLVVKNQVLRRALEELDIRGAERFLNGQNAMVTGSADVTSIAKELKNFAGSKQALVIKGGFIGKEIFGADKIDILSTLPSREVLLGMFCGAMNAPVSGFVNTLSAILREFVGTVQAVADKRAKQ